LSSETKEYFLSRDNNIWLILAKKYFLAKKYPQPFHKEGGKYPYIELVYT